jgi:hypothetical protein
LSAYTYEMNKLVHSASADPVGSGKPTTRTNDPARTMAGILEVATAEFGSHPHQQAHDLLLL